MSTVTMNDVTEFYKILAAWGTISKVDDKLRILNALDSTPITVEVKGSIKELVVLHNNAKMTPEQTAFNPLLETLGHSAERNWYRDSVSVAMGAILMEIIVRICEIVVATETKDPSFEELEMSHPYNDRVDERVAKDINSLDSSKLLHMVYNRRKRTIQLQTKIYDDAYLQELKFSVKGIKALREIFADIMQSEDIHKDYMYQAKALDMPEIECILNIMKMYSKAVGNYAMTFLNIDLFPLELEAHLENVLEYRKKCSWAASGIVHHDHTAAKVQASQPVVRPTSLLPPIGVRTTLPMPGVGGVPRTASYLQQVSMENRMVPMGSYGGYPGVIPGGIPAYGQYGGGVPQRVIGPVAHLMQPTRTGIIIGGGKDAPKSTGSFGKIPRMG